MPMLLTKLMSSGMSSGLVQALGDDVLDSQTATGTNQATAFETSTAIVRFTTVASGTGCLLDNGARGDSQFIINDGANTLSVYPPTGHTINGQSSNVAFTIAAGSWATFDRITDARWVAASNNSTTTFSVKNFGAVGDLSVDDTAAIQRAVDAVGDAGGGVVFFPRGFYKVTSLITISDSRVVLRGEERNAAQVLQYTANSGTFKWTHSDPANTFLFYGGIQDLTVGVQPSLDHNSGVAVDVVRCSGWAMRNATISNHLVCAQFTGTNVGWIDNSVIFNGQYFADKRKSGSRAVVLKNYEASAKQCAVMFFSNSTITGQIAGDGSRDPMTEFALLIDSADSIFFNACIFQQADRLIQLRTSRASDTIASITFDGCFADGNLGGVGSIPTADILFAIDGSAATAAITDIAWTGGQMGNARSDGIVVNEATLRSATFSPGTMSNIGRWAVNATTWAHNLKLGGVFRNFAQNAPTAADGGGVKIGAALSTSRLLLDDLVINGRDYGTSVNGSPGSSGDLGTGLVMSSYAGQYSMPGLQISNCNTPRTVSLATGAVYINTGVAPVTLSPGDFVSNAGSPALGNVGGTRMTGWLLDAGSTESLCCLWKVPAYWPPRFKATILWTNAGAGSGDVVWQLDFLNRVDGDTLNTAYGGLGQFTVVAPAQDVLKETVVATNPTATPGSTWFTRVNRVGGAAADTLGNDVCFLGLELTPI